MRMMIYSVWDRSVGCERGGKKLLLNTGSGSSQDLKEFMIQQVFTGNLLFWSF